VDGARTSSPKVGGLVCPGLTVLPRKRSCQSSPSPRRGNHLRTRESKFVAKPAVPYQRYRLAGADTFGIFWVVFWQHDTNTRCQRIHVDLFVSLVAAKRMMKCVEQLSFRRPSLMRPANSVISAANSAIRSLIRSDITTSS